MFIALFFEFVQLALQKFQRGMGADVIEEISCVVWMSDYRC